MILHHKRLLYTCTWSLYLTEDKLNENRSLEKIFGMEEGARLRRESETRRETINLVMI